MEPNHRIDIAKHSVRIDQLEARANKAQDEHDDLADAVAKLSNLVAGLQVQTRITWALLFLLIASVVGVAFSLWQGGVP